MLFLYNVQLPGLDVAALPSKLVSNSFAVDNEYGAYIVTSIAMNKVVYNEATQTLALLWTTPYSDGQDPWLMGRLGPGSGSSPTLMSATDNHNEKPDYVVITDGNTSPMRILAFDAESGDLLPRQNLLISATQRDSVLQSPPNKVLSLLAIVLSLSTTT